MFESTNFRRGTIFGALAGAAAALATPHLAFAQAMPLDFAASPEVYKVVAENDQYRMVLGQWRPGQRDAFHSHPAMLYYWLTDCRFRSHYPGGEWRDVDVKAGQANSQAPVPSHFVENRSTTECKILMLEPKSAP